MNVFLESLYGEIKMHFQCLGFLKFEGFIVTQNSLANPVTRLNSFL